MTIGDLEAKIKQSDCIAIKQILLDGVALNIGDNMRFWDGYAMCLANFEKALVTNIQINDNNLV